MPSPVFRRYSQRIYRSDCFEIDIRELKAVGALAPGKHKLARIYRWPDGAFAFRLDIETQIRPDGSGRIVMLHKPHRTPYDREIVLDDWCGRAKFATGQGKGAYLLLRPPRHLGDRFETIAELGGVCFPIRRVWQSRRKAHHEVVLHRWRVYRQRIARLKAKPIP